MVSFLLNIANLFMSWLCEAALWKLVAQDPPLQWPEARTKQNNNKTPKKTQRFILVDKWFHGGFALEGKVDSQETER